MEAREIIGEILGLTPYLTIPYPMIPSRMTLLILPRMVLMTLLEIEVHLLQGGL